MIAIGSDHGGFALKSEILAHLEASHVAYKDFGTCNEDSVDYPDIAKTVCEALLRGEFAYALLFCGTGVGISIAANKIEGIRAACCSDVFSARLTRQHNNANVLCLGGRVLGGGLAAMMVDEFLNTPFQGGRHAVRVDKIAGLERGNREE